MVTEVDLNQEAIDGLAAEAANARLNESPPDGIVMRAIGLGLGTRREIKETTGYGYDVIEKVIERNSGDLRFTTVGQIERIEMAASPFGAKPATYICIDCGEPRSPGSASRCKDCYKAKAEASRRPPRPDLDQRDRAHQERAERNVIEEIQMKPHSNGGKFGISVGAEIRKIVEGMPAGTEMDTPRLFSALLDAHPQLRSSSDHATLRTYISQALSPLKGKLVTLAHKGQGGSPHVFCRVSANGNGSLSKSGHDSSQTLTGKRTQSRVASQSQSINRDKTKDSVADSSVSTETGKSAIDNVLIGLRAKRDELSQVISFLEREFCGGGRWLRLVAKVA